MDKKNTPSAQSLRESSKEMHRQQMLWQVWVPLGVTLAIVLALIVLAIIGTIQGSSQIERWGNLSALIVILPVMLWGVVLLVIVGGTAYGVSKLLKKTPGWMEQLQDFMVRLSAMVRKVSDKSVQPVLAVNANSARAGFLWNKIFRRKSAAPTK